MTKQSSQAQAFQPMSLDVGPSDDEIAQFALSRGAQQTVLKSRTPAKPIPAMEPSQASQAAAGSSASMKPVKLDLPDYLRLALKIRAAEQGVSARYLIMRALQADGFKIDEADMIEDGRRTNALRRT